MKSLPTGMVLLFTAAVSAWAGADEINLGAHRKWDPQALQVIEEKCLVCHNRQRVDAALAEQKQMEKIQELMEAKGLVLSDKERQVLGHFWEQNAFKGK